MDLEVLHNIIAYPCFIKWAQGDNCLCLARERWSVDWLWSISALCSAQFVVRSTREAWGLLQDHVLFHLTPFICHCDMCYLTVTCWAVSTVAGKPEYQIFSTEIWVVWFCLRVWLSRVIHIILHLKLMRSFLNLWFYYRDSDTIKYEIQHRGTLCSCWESLALPDN